MISLPLIKLILSMLIAHDHDNYAHVSLPNKKQKEEQFTPNYDEMISLLRQISAKTVTIFRSCANKQQRYFLNIVLKWFFMFALCCSKGVKSRIECRQQSCV